MLAQFNNNKKVNMPWQLKALACNCVETKIVQKVINSESVLAFMGMNTPYIITGHYHTNYHLLYTSQLYYNVS